MRLIKGAIVAALLCLPQIANASTASSGYIYEIYVMGNGTVLFSQTGVRTSAPSCQAGSVPARWSFDGSTAAGQEKMALLLSAFALHKPISIVGTGACTAWSDTETTDHFKIEGS